MPLTAWLSRSAFLLSMTAWSFVMVIMGLLLLIEFPVRFRPMGEHWARVFMIAGVAVLAMGEFMFIFVARRVFPMADARVAGVMEALPWIGLAGAGVLGVVHWIA